MDPKSISRLITEDISTNNGVEFYEDLLYFSEYVPVEDRVRFEELVKEGNLDEAGGLIDEGKWLDKAKKFGREAATYGAMGLAALGPSAAGLTAAHYGDQGGEPERAAVGAERPGETSTPAIDRRGELPPQSESEQLKSQLERDAFDLHSIVRHNHDGGGICPLCSDKDKAKWHKTYRFAHSGGEVKKLMDNTKRDARIERLRDDIRTNVNILDEMGEEYEDPFRFGSDAETLGV